ncbi:hypothetical protein M9Y10_009485 [Tritrichomonas musculus]|uniref:Arrestin-like N-terminal domain-containing protein n=1 Tax=Tritrichomonas musculus TaxID=1915356 RepID=A0ABR2IQ00_9EUKA
MSAITISVKKIQRNDKYKPLLNNIQNEIFLGGDSIQGGVQINPTKYGKLKHKGITVKLIGKYICTDVLTNEFIVHQMDICDSGIFEKITNLSFTFDKPRIQYPSYHGHKMSLTYYIVVEVKQFALLSPKISQSYEVIFLLPYKRTNPIPPISLSVSQPFICFDVVTQKGIYSTTDTISGQIDCKNIQQTGIEKIVMNIVLTEKIKEKKESRTEESTLIQYELTDGCPRPGSKIPFRLNLRPYFIWTIKMNQGSTLSATHRIEIYIHKGGVSTLVAQHPVLFYLHYIP